MKKIFYKITLIAAFISLNTACTTDDLAPSLEQHKEYLEGSLTNVNNLKSILRGAHERLTSVGYYGRDVIATNEVRSDNCFSNGNSGRFSTQAEFRYNNNTDFIWNNAYQVISNANIIIGADITGWEDADEAKSIQGQAMFLRALAHYDLVRVFGQQHTTSGDLAAPVVLIYKDESNLFPARNTINELKAQVYADLQSAFDMMDDSFISTKIFPTKYAAKALEARVALYFGDWEEARDAAKIVIDNGGYTIANSDDYVSNWEAKETSNSIYEIAFGEDDNLGSDSLGYIYRYPGDAPAGYGDVQVVSSVAGLYEAGDVRLDILGYQAGGTVLRNMKKYGDTANGTDNIIVIRFEEVVLTYAEALFEINNADPEALTYLNMIPQNRTASNYTAVTKDNILLERRKEFVFEGLRFDDLVRTGKDIDIIGSTGTVTSTLSYPNDKFAYPIPAGEMNANSNMVQNNGY